jgi:hypothetical protein
MPALLDTSKEATAWSALKRYKGRTGRVFAPVGDIGAGIAVAPSSELRESARRHELVQLWACHGHDGPCKTKMGCAYIGQGLVWGSMLIRAEALPPTLLQMAGFDDLGGLRWETQEFHGRPLVDSETVLVALYLNLGAL